MVPRHRYFLHVHARRQRAAAAAPAASASAAAAATVSINDIPFPLGNLKCSDAQFAKLCGTSLEEYEQWRERLGLA